MNPSELVAEYEGAAFGDVRLTRRLALLASRRAAGPAASFPKSLNESELEGAYRFFGNKRVSPDAVLDPHVRQTLSRLAGNDVVLAVHDTTTLSFRNEGQREGFGSLGGEMQNLWTHATLAVAGDETRCPHGLLVLSTETSIRHGRWIEHVMEADRIAGASTLVHVMDREADDYALFAHLVADKSRFVIRLQHDRSVGEDGAITRISQALAHPTVTAEREVTFGARGTARGSKARKIHPRRAERAAHLMISAVPITLRKPGHRKDVPDRLDIHAVRVWEMSPPPGEPEVEWVLLTSEAIDTPELLLRVVDWYRARWVIEEFFKAMKTGCSIEKRQLASFESFANAVSFFGPIAWQLLLLRHRAQHDPSRDGSSSLPAEMLEVLRHIARKPLPALPTAQEVLFAVAALGGHLKRNGPPGWQTLGHGYEKLREATEIWQLATRITTCDQS